MNNAQMEHWFNSALGKILLEAESNLLNVLLPHLFGYYLLQVGGPTSHHWLEHCRIPQRIHLSDHCPCDFVKGVCVCGDFAALPFAPDSIDVALLPHVLEVAKNPQEILADVYNTLIPEGYVVILSFQPWSLWGLTRLFKNRKKAPWSGKFYSSYRIRKWLTALDFKIEDHKTLFFRPPVKGAKDLRQLLFLEAVGQLLWPYLGAVSLIVAKKRIHGMRLIPNKGLTKKKIAVPRSVPQPTTRASKE